MGSKRRTLSSPESSQQQGRRLRSRWLWAVVMLLGVFTSAQAQTRDVITITGAKVGTADAGGSFKTGAVSSEHPGVYVIDVGDIAARPQMDDEGYPVYETVTVTLSRPLGATAKRAATVKLGNMRFWGEGETITFLPGETTKTVEIPVNIEPTGFYEDEQGEWREMYTWSGNIPEIFTITTTYADAEYDALILKTNRTDADAPRESPFATKLEVLQNTFGNDHANYQVTRWGDYILFRFFLATDVKIGADSRYVINARFADHTNLGPDDDDYGMAQTHEVELHPINAGSVCSEAWYIYRPSPDEYLHSLDVNHSEYTDRAVEYPVLEVGPFEVANPAEDAVRYIFYSRADLPEESANTLFGVYLQVDGLMPEFSNVSINKTSFKSGETMVITATMDNWQFVKRCQDKWFNSAFGVTINDNESLEPTRYTFDEQTGLVTYYVTAPTVEETKEIYVDFGPACRVIEDNLIGDKKVLTCPESSFAVSISPEAATPNPITELDIPGLPADGSLIILNKFEEYLGLIFWDTRIERKEFPINPVYSPIDATNANHITYAVTNSDGAKAEIIYDKFNGVFLSTGVEEGSFTFTASVDGEVLFSRNYLLMHKLGEGSDLAMPEPLNHINKYFIGTTFPQFQFEYKNTDNRPVDDAITVNYTHANGTTWTETYSLKALKSEESDRESMVYNLPFSFTEEHPDVTDASQIGETIVTAQVTISVPTTEGTRDTVECTSLLQSDLKALSFDDYREMEAYSNEQHPVTLTSEVMYLPRAGFTVGYEIPELNEQKLYNSLTDGDNVPDWLELHENEFYCTANITVKKHPDASTSKYHLYTLAQRSYNPDEVMVREMTTVATLKRVDFEDHIKYLVNGEPASSNLTFDNTTSAENFFDWFKKEGFVLEDITWGRNNPVLKPLREMLYETAAHISIHDDYFDGAEVTLKCEDDTIQHLTKYNGDFTFMPPTDGKTYTVDVYFPDYGRRYTNTFKSHTLENIYYMVVMPFPPIGNTWPILEFQGGTLDYSKYGKGTVFQAYGYLYNEDRSKFYLRIRRGLPRNPAGPPLRVQISDAAKNLFKPFEFEKSSKPELKLSAYSPSFDAASGWKDKLDANYGIYYWHGRMCDLEFDLNKVTAGSTFVDLVNSKGDIITDATINYACADSLMNIAGLAGSTQYDDVVKSYQIRTDPEQYVEFIEVVAPGYKPTLVSMYLRDFDYNANLRQRGVRRQSIVLIKDVDRVSNLTMETPMRSGNLENDTLDAAINYGNLLMLEAGDTLHFSPTADYKDVVKTMTDGKFGNDGWKGTKYAHLTGNVSYQGSFDVAQLRLKNSSVDLAPQSCKLITPQEFKTFKNNYCVFDFDLTDKIDIDESLKADLKVGDETVFKLPVLHNHSVNLTALNEANNFSLDNLQPDVQQADDNVGLDEDNGGAAFDNFNFQSPPGLPFTINIERKGNDFLVRAVCERNFIPGGKVMDALDKLDNLKYFDERYQACVDAVNSAKPVDDGFFDDIPRFPSAFCGIKGFLCGSGHYNPKTGDFDITFHSGGITFEASASASASVSFGVGGFGVSVDAKLATTLAVVNANAVNGDAVSLPRIDFVLDNQCRLKMCAWAYAGIDLWIAKAVVGVRGGACMDLRTRLVVPTYGEETKAGLSASFKAAMEAYSELRLLFITKKWSKRLLDASALYLEPNDLSNPLHPSNLEKEVFSLTRNVTKSYKKLKRKVIADLGTPIISKVSGMARPAYMLGGNSLLFNNLKTPSDYNDDCLQMFSNGHKNDILDLGLDAPMYDFSVARGANKDMVVFEQVNTTIEKNGLEAQSELAQTKQVSENTDVYVATYDGSSWQYENLTPDAYGMACVNPVVAIQNDGKAVAVWQQGKAKFNDSGDRYIDGSMMMKRYDGSAWGEPIEIKRLNRRSVPTDYQVSMKEDSVLVMMTLQQDVNNQDKQPSITYVTISPDDKVRERYTLMEGSKPQMVHVNGVNLVGFLSRETDGRDVHLRTVNMKGEPTGKVSGSLGMQRRMVNDFRLIVDDEATGLDGISLLWNQSDQETTTNPETNEVNVKFKNRIYTSKLCGHDKQLYFSTPVEVATMPDDVSLVSMDGYLDGLDMKVAYCVANDEDGAAILETPVAFTNAIDHRVTYNEHQVSSSQSVPVNITVVNNGFEPIDKLEVMLGDTTYVHEMMLMPQESVELTDDYPVRDNFNGTIDYDVTANFILANSNSLKMRRRAAARPHRISQSGTQTDIRQVDMILNVLSKRTDAEGKTTIVAEVNNTSFLPLADDVTVKVGLYNSPLATQNYPGTTEVTVTAADLYDGTEKQNKVKIISLTAEKPDIDQVLYLRATTMQGAEVATDVNPTNNILPVRLTGKTLVGDVNNDGKVDVSDYIGVANHILGNTPDGFKERAADVNGDDVIDVSDYIGIANIILTGSPTGKSQQSRINKNGYIE